MNHSSSGPPLLTAAAAAAREIRARQRQLEDTPDDAADDDDTPDWDHTDGGHNYDSEHEQDNCVTQLGSRNVEWDADEAEEEGGEEQDGSLPFTENNLADDYPQPPATDATIPLADGVPGLSNAEANVGRLGMLNMQRIAGMAAAATIADAGTDAFQIQNSNSFLNNDSNLNAHQPPSKPTLQPPDVPVVAVSGLPGNVSAPPAPGDGPRATVKEGKHHKTWKPERVTVKVNDFKGTPGTTRSARSIRSKPVLEPIEYWSMFITEPMLQEVLDETNAYKHRLLGNAHLRPAYISKRCSWPPKWTSRQKDRTMPDLKKFLGSLYGLAVGGKGGCSVRHMLSDHADAEFTEVPWLKRRGVTESWLTGWFQNIHCQPEGWETSEEAKRPAQNAKKKRDERERTGEASEEGEAREEAANVQMPHNHNVKKIGRFLEQLNQNCLLAYTVHEMISIDEQTALCNSRIATLKHVQRHKKYDGIRIYSINGSGHVDAGYTQYFMVDWKCGYHATVFADKLLDIMDPVWYKVYMDNAFTTVTNLLKWREQSMNVCGTSRKNFGFPAELDKLKRPTTIKDPPLKKGQSKWLMSDDGLFAAIWHDVGYCKFLSNFHMPDPTTCARRVKKSEAADAVNGRIMRDTLFGIMMYNMFMGGTDRCDSLRGFNSTQRKSVKWWHSLFFWALDIAYVNAYAVYLFDFEANRKDAKEKPMPRKVFITKIAKELMGKPPNTILGKKRKAGDEQGKDKWVCHGQRICMIVREDKGKIPGQKRKGAARVNCALCKVKNARLVKARLECKGCGFALHDKCIEEWHNEHSIPPLQVV